MQHYNINMYLSGCEVTAFLWNNQENQEKSQKKICVS